MGPCFVCGTSANRVCEGGCKRDLCLDCTFTLTSIGQLQCWDCAAVHGGLPTSGEYASQSYYNNPHSRKRKGDWATLGQRAPHMVSKSAASEGHRLASNGDGFRVLGSSRLADCTTLGSGSSNALRELNHHVDQHVARLQQQLQLQPPSWPSNSCHAILEAQARATMVCEGSGPSAAESSSIVTMKMD